MERRQFLKTSAMAGTLLAFSGSNVWAKSTDAQVEIFLDEPIGRISPNIYGQFTEQLGGVIYGGVWVGEDSKIPNRHGIRAELLDRLKQMHVPVIRWPGGCFADSYDWRDGIGPAAKRPRRTNFWEVSPDAAKLHGNAPQVFDPNAFGTNEFMRFCQLSGAEPYLAANVRSLSPMVFDRWVEYCNSPAGSTSMADMRAAAGFPAPFQVKYWGVGNESWGCGGNFTPEDYAAAFRRYTSWLPRYGVDLQLVGSGPSENDIDWTHRFFKEMYTGHVDNDPAFTGWSVHYYVTDRGQSSNGKMQSGDALRFQDADWYEVLRESDYMGRIIQDQWTVMGQYDIDHRVKLVVDEYGPWYRQGTDQDPSHIFGQQITVRDALATALTLDTFNRHAEKVGMAANAQLINCINALFLAQEDRFVATPNFYVFEMYAAHQGGQSLRTEFSAPDLHYTRNGKQLALWGLNGSASRKGNAVTLTMVNPDSSKPSETQVALRGASVASATGEVLAAGDVHAHNSFDRPDVVKTVPLSVTSSGGILSLTLPAASVAKLEIVLA